MLIVAAENRGADAVRTKRHTAENYSEKLVSDLQTRISTNRRRAPMSGRCSIANECRTTVGRPLHNLRMFDATCGRWGIQVGVSPMSSIEQRLAAVTKRTANLYASDED